METTALPALPPPPHRSCLRRLSGAPKPLVRLVCFPWCGAGASVYRRLAACLPAHIEVLAVQLPGREERFKEPRLRRMQALVDHAMGDVAEVFDRPLVLFGHSMGALAAYEVALALRARMGREPQGLVVSGHAAPGWPAQHPQAWHTADDRAFIANLRQLGGTPAQVLADADMVRALVPLVRADYEIVETYEAGPRPALHCPVVACAGVDDTEAAPPSLAPWRSVTQGACALHAFDGGHFYLSAQPQVLAQRLQGWVDAMCSMQEAQP